MCPYFQFLQEGIHYNYRGDILRSEQGSLSLSHSLSLSSLSLSFFSLSFLFLCLPLPPLSLSNHSPPSLMKSTLLRPNPLSHFFKIFPSILHLFPSSGYFFIRCLLSSISFAYSLPPFFLLISFFF